MNAETIYAEAVAAREAWDAAGIPWNKKGSPHKLLLRSRALLKRLPLSFVIQNTIRKLRPQLVANIAGYNRLAQRMKNK